jgi:lipid-A-disaccharide synthase-like uncharacterized protein
MKLNANVEILWLILGFLGQFFFFLRFFFQWLVSEKRKESIIPVSFWYFSIFGGVLLLIYSVYRRDPVFIVGQSLGVLIYARNLYFVYKKKA